MSTDPGRGPKASGWGVLAWVGLGIAGLVALVLGLGLYRGSTTETSEPIGAAQSPVADASAVATKSAAPAIASNVDAARSIATSLVGDRICAECHPGEAAYHSGSGHSKTLRPAALTAVARWLHGRRINDPENPEVTWTYALIGDRLEVERAEGGRFHRFELNYAIGSGEVGMTFVSTFPESQPGRGATGVEHRTSYFSRGPTLTITPGQEEGGETDSAFDLEAPHQPRRNLGGSALDETLLDQCFTCHATLTNGTSGTGVDLATLRPNVGCERCHGPGKAHVEAARRDADVAELAMPHGSSGATSAALQIHLCGECHRRLDTVRPSEISPRNARIARFQPLGLQLSRCYQDGATGLRCTSCHDPHSRVKKDLKTYESVCQGCHNPSKQSVCPVSNGTGCVDCHMPLRNLTPEVDFHDHWIRVPDDKKSGAGKSPR
ncbi:MAG: cytochrome c3 family protein [Isosphaeraceae bacterium]